MASKQVTTADYSQSAPSEEVLAAREKAVQERIAEDDARGAAETAFYLAVGLTEKQLRKANGISLEAVESLRAAWIEHAMEAHRQRVRHARVTELNDKHMKAAIEHHAKQFMQANEILRPVVEAYEAAAYWRGQADARKEQELEGARADGFVTNF